jgi:hypothetical protein
MGKRKKENSVSLDGAINDLFGQFDREVNLAAPFAAAALIAEGMKSFGVADDPTSILILDSVEFHLVTRLATSGVSRLLEENLNVTADEFYTAMEKLRCPWLSCSMRLATAPTVADVIPFPGDLIKSGMKPDAAPDPNVFVSGAPAVAVQDAYESSGPFGRYGSVANSPMLVIQGGIWVLRAQLLRYPRHLNAESDDLPPLIYEYLRGESSSRLFRYQR